jgi:hypothetical protein
MPRRKDDPPGPSSVVHINVPEQVMERVKKARPSGGFSGMSESTFLGYLVGLGINVYEKGILPLERGEGLAVDLALNRETPTGNHLVDTYMPLFKAMSEEMLRKRALDDSPLEDGKAE